MPVSNEDFEEISFVLLLGAIFVAFVFLWLWYPIFWIVVMLIFALVCAFGIHVAESSFFLGMGIIVLLLTSWFSLVASLGAEGIVL